MITDNRLDSWNLYYTLLDPLFRDGFIELPVIPDDCEHNAHMFYIKVSGLRERECLEEFLRKNQIKANFHYIPLHSSPAGEKYGEFHGNDIYTTKESERLLRLPMYYNLKAEDVEYISQKVHEFYGRA
jgi:dTDP-4-amino-4,6-dideoxygalactose transaminase